ncbi:MULTISPECIES: alpha/beta fold hydrolase [unclassified Pseudomonas]|uniref:alpha/beta fold hydrolase n=2 Tax=Pseudomonas TaxID=286 RepID=UPI0002A35BB3|nr:alpha/beta hydrolase [Pseudomonas sp. UMC76]MBB1637533.1 alpha/beta hydrolase [Pseudomonas sp. UME83]NTX87607.1 alpha/beta hydrolase [Pseudomonas sp. UMA643]NTY18059.1 alpha/beta hydrolase [Pseudomonas sp. UMC3103]NTY24491.1 alpha/beta hydrolase [Pseudomonas sp. UMA603]NTY30046.1 alpha/beta hydrolase [Pseudomonas sp. UMC3129]NTY55029.1 alpha/beta hydrolase [Pseudomonas sp. UMC631]NTY64870.1 alpha/beta hydrolase [Pseudomonas sp. UMC3106]NUA33095.1 alpha/beta hydrolase [Pseudomonas sp. UMA
MFEGFSDVSATVDGIKIHALMAGAGPALLLLHGHPQTHAIWHKVAPTLARQFTIVVADLRGYGDSGKPPGEPDHANYAKRRMALDQVRLMQALGLPTFAVIGHDRGGRVAARMALDHPDVVSHLVTLDVAPTLAMYQQTSFEFARAYWHWFFLVRPAPFPETLIRADPDLYLKQTIGARSAGLKPFAPEAYAAYLRCLSDPATAHGICEDYRASVGIDLEHDQADLAAGKQIQCPFLALWGRDGVIERCFDPLAEWRRWNPGVKGMALPCGHYIPEEAPEVLLDHVLAFLPS